MMHENDREWKGIWIPKEVWLDERLSALEKIILFEVDSLDKDNGCYATNEYMANFCQCSAWKVSTAISKLIELGYVKVVSFDGRHRTLKSCIRFTTEQPLEIPKSAFGETHAINTSYKNKIDTNTSPADDGENNGFAEFWELYPRKVARPAALKAWKALRLGDSARGQVLADLNRRLAGEWAKKDKQYIPHPTTYLHQRRWEDEVEDTVQDTVQDDTVGPFGAWRV